MVTSLFDMALTAQILIILYEYYEKTQSGELTYYAMRIFTHIILQENLDLNLICRIILQSIGLRRYL